jgi:hypothetical protein
MLSDQAEELSVRLRYQGLHQDPSCHGERGTTHATDTVKLVPTLVSILPHHSVEAPLKRSEDASAIDFVRCTSLSM